MTETEKMLAILRERGIEYREVNSMVTDIEHDDIKTRVYDYDDGPDYQLCVEQKWLTAEEAVRVALGIKPQEVLERRIDELEEENAKLRELLGDALKTLFHKRLDGSVGCTENCPRWQFGKDCQLVDGCWLELEAARLGIEVPDGS